MSIRIFATTGPGLLEHGIHEGRVYPAFGTVGFDRYTPEASDDEVNEVLGAFSSLNWVHPLASELLLGWLGVAATAAALRRRPHVMLTGPRGCGKSTVLELVKEMLGVMCTAFTGVPTEAGLRQRLAGKPTAALIDEFEYDPSKKNCRDTLEHARSAYSLQEGDEGVVRGSVTGKAVSFRIVSPFLVAGISPGRMEPADVSRWVVLEAKDRKVDGNMLDKARAREIGPKLAKRFVGRWSVFQASEAVVRDCTIASGGDGRMADTVGTLPSLRLTDVRLTPEMVKENERMLTGGFYAEVTLGYDASIAQEKGGRPFGVEALRAIQLSKREVLDVLAKGREQFSTAEWRDLLLRSVGFEPETLSERAKDALLLRMVPFVERNYNLVELGPRGTGKSHLFQQVSPYAHLISGGKATVARMFVNNASGQRGLVCQYDVVCFDEVSGLQRLVTLVADAHQPALIELDDLRLEALGAQLARVGFDGSYLVEAEVPSEVWPVLDGDAEAASVGDVRHKGSPVSEETPVGKAAYTGPTSVPLDLRRLAQIWHRHPTNENAAEYAAGLSD